MPATEAMFELATDYYIRSRPEALRHLIPQYRLLKIRLN